MMGALYFALLGFCELYGGFNQVRAADVKSSGTTGDAGGTPGNAG